MDPSQALIVSVERVAAQLKQAEQRIAEAQKKKVELCGQTLHAEQELLLAKDLLQAAQQQHASAAAGVKSFEDELARQSANNARLKKEIHAIQDQMEQLSQQENKDMIEFLQLCQEQRQATRALVQQCDAASGLVGAPAF